MLKSLYNTVIKGVCEITRRLRIVRLKSFNGEIHFVIQESGALESSSKGKNYDEAEAIKVTKKEASKPLLLLREE